MRQSAHTSALALRQCIMQCHPGVHEHQIAASFGELVMALAPGSTMSASSPLPLAGQVLGLSRRVSVPPCAL